VLESEIVALLHRDQIQLRFGGWFDCDLLNCVSFFNPQCIGNTQLKNSL
jgi:hypothetical protein